MAKFNKSLWVQEEVEFDGHTFKNSTFERCTLIFAAKAPVKLEDCRFIQCRWVFKDSAALTIDFLRQMGTGGGEEVTDPIFQKMIHMHQDRHGRILEAEPIEWYAIPGATAHE